MRVHVDIPEGCTCLNCVFLFRHQSRPVCIYHKQVGVADFTFLDDIHNDSTGLVEWYNANKCRACLDLFSSAEERESASINTVTGHRPLFGDTDE